MSYLNVGFLSHFAAKLLKINQNNAICGSILAIIQSDSLNSTISDTKIIRFCIFDKVTFEYNTNIISDFDSHYVIHFAYCISKSIYDNPTILISEDSI